jgi:hypothetical protein
MNVENARKRSDQCDLEGGPRRSEEPEILQIPKGNICLYIIIIGNPVENMLYFPQIT